MCSWGRCVCVYLNIKNFPYYYFLFFFFYITFFISLYLNITIIYFSTLFNSVSIQFLFQHLCLCVCMWVVFLWKMPAFLLYHFSIPKPYSRNIKYKKKLYLMLAELGFCAMSMYASISEKFNYPHIHTAPTTFISLIYIFFYYSVLFFLFVC